MCSSLKKGQVQRPRGGVGLVHLGDAKGCRMDRVVRDEAGDRGRERD